MKGRSRKPSSRLTRLAQRSLLPIKRAWLGRRVGRLLIEHVCDMPVIVLPDVFNAAVFRTSAPLVEAIDRHVGPGIRVLDLGTGTGVAAIRAALRGATVVAVDSNPEAVRCARLNALLNRVEDRVEVRQGDLYRPVENEAFDIVLCNPPFFRGKPRHLRDRAWRSDDFIERFAAGLATVLGPSGQALMVFSSDGDEQAMLDAFADEGFHAVSAHANDLGNEVITVYRVTAATAS
jgi:HemK-related putative methylase